MIRLNRQSKKKLNNNSSSIKRVKFSDQILLVESIKDNDFESVKSLLKKKSSNIDINKINDSGLTLLHHAVLENSLDIVKTLVEHKADVNVGDKDKWTPLHTAASFGYYDISKYLLNNGADSNALTRENLKAIDLIDTENFELVKLFHSFEKSNLIKDTSTKYKK